MCIVGCEIGYYSDNCKKGIVLVLKVIYFYVDYIII